MKLLFVARRRCQQTPGHLIRIFNANLCEPFFFWYTIYMLGTFSCQGNTLLRKVFMFAVQSAAHAAAHLSEVSGLSSGAVPAFNPGVCQRRARGGRLGTEYRFVPA
jgi:hypothetical protein